MTKRCQCCNEEISRKKTYCSYTCREIYKHCSREKEQLYDTLRQIVDPIALESFKDYIEESFHNQMLLKKKLIIVEKRLEEQDNMWENLVYDLKDETISPSHIRWWKNKLVKEFHVNAQSRMINWLSGVADVLDSYQKAKNSEENA